MSLKPTPVGPVPEMTALVARAAFPKGNPYLRLRDELGAVFCDDDFAGLYPRRGQPAFAPWRLALVSVLQFREDLSDRRAADAVRSRIDWKYLLGLELTDPGFDFSVLSEFRARLLAGAAGEQPLEKLLSVRLDELLTPYPDSGLTHLGWLRQAGDDARAAFVGEVRVSPLQQNSEFVAEANQENQVHEKPSQPGQQTGKL